jgi:hypothetical protein
VEVNLRGEGEEGTIVRLFASKQEPYQHSKGVNVWVSIYAVSGARDKGGPWDESYTGFFRVLLSLEHLRSLEGQEAHALGHPVLALEARQTKVGHLSVEMLVQLSPRQVFVK